MQLQIDDSQLTQAVDEVIAKRGYSPTDELVGKTISLKEFAHKYCYPHGINWVKAEIIYKFKPDWVAEINPGTGRGFTIFEHPAALWMEKHRKEIDWNA